MSFADVVTECWQCPPVILPVLMQRESWSGKARAWSLFGYSLFLTQINAGENLLFPREEIAAGASGTLVKGERFTPSQQGTVVYFSVEDIEDVCNKAKASGGSVVVPATPIGDGWGVFAHLLDTEGNKIGVWSKS